MENAAHIEEMQEQREVEVEEINRNTERIKEQVDGVGEGLKEQLQSEYDAVTQAAQDAADKPLGDDALEEDEEDDEPSEELPYSLDLYLSATGSLTVHSLQPPTCGSANSGHSHVAGHVQASGRDSQPNQRAEPRDSGE